MSENEPTGPDAVGPTGEPPTSGIPADRGGLNAVVTGLPHKRLVIITFGTTLSFLTMSPDEARRFADVLRDRADHAEGRPPAAPPRRRPRRT